MKPILFNNYILEAEKIAAIGPEIAKKISESLHLLFITEKEVRENVCFANSPEVRPDFRESFLQIDLCHYYYALLFSSKYREHVSDFLKSNSDDFQIPINNTYFWQLSQLGKKLRQLHLSETDIIEENKTVFCGADNNVISKPHYVNSFTQKENYTSQASTCDNVPLHEFGRLYLNENQYFDTVRNTVWNFNMDRELLLQKIITQREGQILTEAIILEIQKTIAILNETIKIIEEIDNTTIK